MFQKAQKIVDNLWWMFVLQGILTVLFGLVALFLPGVTLVTLVYLSATYILALSIVALVQAALRRSKDSGWWFLALVGLVGVCVGFYLMGNPKLAIGTFLGIVSLLLFIRGIFDLFLSAYMVKSKDGRMLWAISGVVGIIAAIVLWMYPVQTGVAFIWVLGLYALVAGIVSLIYAYRARRFIDDLKHKLK